MPTVRRRPALLLLLVLTGLFSVEPVFAQTGLWERARAVYARNLDWTPSRLITMMESLDGSGRVTKTERVVMSLRVDAEGNSVTDILEATEDGRDVTEERQEAARRQQANAGNDENRESPMSSMNFGFDSSPFDERERASVTYTQTASTRNVDGRRCRGFSFVWTLPENAGAYRGTAWIDETTGAALLLEYVMDPRPFYISSLEISISYLYRSAGEWYPVSVRFEGEGGILFVRQRMRSSLAFSDYVRRDGSR